MKALAIFALIAASAPAAAAALQQDVAVTPPRERSVCTRVVLRGASRISYQRVCKTPSEWRERLGPDWRQLLNGQNSVEDDLDNLETVSRATNSRGSGALGGGFSGGGPR